MKTKSVSRLALVILVLMAMLTASVTLADSNTSNFDSYTVGNINGQDGWTKTGAYDVAVVNNTYGYSSFGTKSLRISDAVTSGGFGDQLFAKPLINAVGETTATAGTFSVGTRQNHFEMQFDIASAVPTAQQPGMHVSVSPDRGDGSRMSYLRFEDGANGIDVFFDDVHQTAACTPSSCANFVESTIATGLNRAVPHTVKLTLDVFDGPSNDFVQVWIDGALAKTGTSWEDYYRYDPEASAEPSPRIVKTVIFRESGTNHPANAGKGFLFDNLTISSSIVSSTPPVASWTARYNGATNSGDDFAKAVATDAQGNSYVTGQSANPSGGSAFATVKYGPVGNQIWVARYTGPANGSDYGSAIAVDPQGNVYVTGASEGVGTSIDYATVKYDSNGSQLWVARYSSPGLAGDYPMALALDGQGNAYVTGWSAGDYATVKYSPAGVQVWAQRYNGPANGEDIASSIAVDAQANVYVAGESYASPESYEITVVKYNTAGNQQWVVRTPAPAVVDPDGRTGLAVDPAGNVYVAGPGGASINSFVTAKYNASGVQLWAAVYAGPTNLGAYPIGLALDGQQNVFVTGYAYLSGGPVPDNEMVTIKYDTNGVRKWVAEYDGAVAKPNLPNAIGVDARGNVFVTGQTNWQASANFATIKYDTNGNTVWVATYDGPANGSDYANSLAVHSSGAVFVTGASTGTGTGYDYLTIKYPGSRPAWDVNGDGVINILDVMAIGEKWGQAGAPGWIPEDVDGNGVINILDVMAVGDHWGQTW